LAELGCKGPIRIACDESRLDGASTTASVAARPHRQHRTDLSLPRRRRHPGNLCPANDRRLAYPGQEDTHGTRLINDPITRIEAI
jgi:hypothetical protein